ncbi:MAG: hypothetical protein AB7S92_10260 [Parvibaculaceae bacterium]
MRSVEASDRTEPYQGHVNRPVRVSPELAEILHMLSSLEDHLVTKTGAED